MEGGITLELPVKQTQEFEFYLVRAGDGSVALRARLPNGITQEVLRVGPRGISRPDWVSPGLPIDREDDSPTGPIAVVG